MGMACGQCVIGCLRYRGIPGPQKATLTGLHALITHHRLPISQTGGMERDSEMKPLWLECPYPNGINGQAYGLGRALLGRVARMVR